ncbi:MAG: hypothetical protein J6M34_06620 [Clostridia bacterium]|nr:hypothetical protein [Clostridia bacterium]
MNQILFGLALILFNFTASFGSAETGTAVILDFLPDFVGYLILWLLLEKRRFNTLVRGLYTGIAIMIPVAFLFFLAQIQNLVIGDAMLDPRNTGWRLLNSILSIVTQIYADYYGFFMMAAALFGGWLLLSLLEYWSRTNQHKLKCAVCRVGMGLSVLSALCHLSSTFLILPFSWDWIAYPLSLLLLGCAAFAMSDAQVIEEKTRD